ncbi:MAG: electron transport complex subunit RsxB [Lysobacterales bacterium]
MIPVLYLTLLVMLSGLALAWATRHFQAPGDAISDMVNAVLPQTQCGRCGFHGCRPYADALALKQADVNRCPPGADTGIRALADLLGRPSKPLDLEIATTTPTVVVIDEQRCIGCTLCIQACPVDAIVGASKLMHTVIESECTGCNRCLPPCPVDCIEIVSGPRYTQPVSASGRDLAPAQSPCIRCGDCASACPEDLAPHELYKLVANGRIETAGETSLDACTECGECNAACPSQIPLFEWLRYGKAELGKARLERLATERAGRRFEARDARLSRLQQERGEAMRKRKQLLADKAAQQERIRASIARAAAKSKPTAGDGKQAG